MTSLLPLRTIVSSALAVSSDLTFENALYSESSRYCRVSQVWPFYNPYVRCWAARHISSPEFLYEFGYEIHVVL